LLASFYFFSVQPFDLLSATSHTGVVTWHFSQP